MMIRCCLHMYPLYLLACTMAASAGLLWLPTAAHTGDAYFDEMKAQTFFAFDEVSIPFSQGLKLEMRSPEKHPANPVLARGAKGSVDSWAVQFYGSVIKIDGKYRMWYVAVGDDRGKRGVARSEPWRVAYAESDDGVNWTKPNLGLVTYNGSTANNLVKMDPHLGVLNVKVLYEPDDPDPSRRYKMGAHVWFPRNKRRLGTLAPYFSADGLNWTLAVDAEPVNAEFQLADMILPPLHTEPVGGMYKWDGAYYVNGQNAIHGTRPYHGRVTRGFFSPDFVNWHHASAVGFVRTPQHTLLGAGKSRDGEQTHEGVSVWHRNNMLLGVCGQWHGKPKEFGGVTIDLGLNYSNDGIHFREPLHEWTFLHHGEDGEWDEGGLLQGQGFENIGEQTFVYYGAWDSRGNSNPRGGVGIAVLPRDRFADLVVDLTAQGPGDYQADEIVSEFITAPIRVQGEGPHRLFLNVDGLGEDAALRVQLMDHRGEYLPGYSGEHAAIIRHNGFQVPITWSAATGELPDRFRVRVTFEGDRREDIRFSALYLWDAVDAP